MNDRFLIEVIHGGHDAILEFLFGFQRSSDARAPVVGADLSLRFKEPFSDLRHQSPTSKPRPKSDMVIPWCFPDRKSMPVRPAVRAHINKSIQILNWRARRD